MVYCIAFDIVSDKVRRHVTKLIKKTGLVRVQKSVFIGASDSVSITDLKTNLLTLLHPTLDKLFIAPLDNLAFQQLTFLGISLDKQLITRQVAVRYF